jgi:hypothetical protein
LISLRKLELRGELGTLRAGKLCLNELKNDVEEFRNGCLVRWDTVPFYRHNGTIYNV